mmetsp:Transcript_39413/g.44862  ORF Transcript_39413/g.44862 Transcript_39413/m.44862 type:complete len:274 (-) Transcript_39413:48-869(-)
MATVNKKIIPTRQISVVCRPGSGDGGNDGGNSSRISNKQLSNTSDTKTKFPEQPSTTEHRDDAPISSEGATSVSEEVKSEEPRSEESKSDSSPSTTTPTTPRIDTPTPINANLYGNGPYNNGICMPYMGNMGANMPPGRVRNFVQLIENFNYFVFMLTQIANLVAQNGHYLNRLAVSVWNLLAKFLQMFYHASCWMAAITPLVYTKLRHNQRFRYKFRVFSIFIRHLFGFSTSNSGPSMLRYLHRSTGMLVFAMMVFSGNRFLTRHSRMCFQS